MIIRIITYDIMYDNVYYKINYIRSTYKAASSSSDESQIQVFVKYPSGKVIMLHVEASDTISNLKKIIKNKESIPHKHQRLFYMSKELEDGRTLSDYDITNEAMLLLGLRIRGGVRAVKKEKFSKNDKMKMAVGMLKTATANIEKDKADFSKDFSKDIKTAIKNLVTKVTTNSNIIETSMKEASNKSLLAVLHTFKSNEFSSRVGSIAKVLFQKEFAVLDDMEELIKDNKEAMKAAAEYIIVVEFMDDSSGIMNNKKIADITQKVLTKEETGEASGLESIFGSMQIDG